ncbi:Ig-like domain-containing protein [Caballeronia sp. KNU42]
MALQTMQPSAAVISSVGSAISGGSITSTTPVIKGTADAGDIVSVYDGVRLIGTALADANGNWTLTPTVALKAGAHNFAAIPQDSHGNFGASSNVVGIQIAPNSTPAPVITDVLDTKGTSSDLVSIPSGSASNGAQPTVSGTGVIGDTVTLYQNGTACGSAVVDATGHWSINVSPALSNGAHVMQATQVGNGLAQSGSSNTWSIIIDTTTPATPSNPSMTDDNGKAIPAGGTTNDPHPHIDGKGTPGDTITVYDNGTVIGSTTIGGDGNWSFTPSPDLGPGAHDIVVVETNPAGTPSPASDPIHVVIDTSTPATPAAPTMTNDSGVAIPAGSTTADAHPHIAGTGTAGDIIKVYDNGVVIGSTTVGGDGKWSFTPATDLSNGSHSITVVDVNAAGTPSAASAPINVVINSTTPATPPAPTMTNDSGVSIPAGSTTADAHPHINGTGTAGDTIKVYDNGVVIGSTTVGADGKWSFTPSTDLSNGTHSITVVDVNAAGTPSAASSPINVVINSSTPAAPPAPILTNDSGVTIPSGSTTAITVPHIGGTGVAGDIIKVYDNGTEIGSTTVGGNGKWTFSPSTDLSVGTHSITVVDVNAAGTPSPASLPTTITVNTSVPATPAAPTLTDDLGGAIPAGSTTVDGHPHMSGTATAGDIIKIYDNGTLIGSTTVDGTGKWTFTPSTDLSNGTHSITVVDVNVAGTPSAASSPISVTINSSTPATPATPTLTNDSSVAIPAGSTTADAHPHINGAGVAGDIIKVYDNGTLIGSTKVAGNGTWTFTPTTDLTDGAHSITVVDVNAAGTSSAPSNPISITVNTSTPATPSAPVMTNDSGATIPAGGATNDPHPHIAGTGTAGDIIKVYDNGVVIGSTTVGGDGKWSFTPATDLSNGSHSITVVDVNAAGTPSAASTPINVVINTSVPATPAAPSLTNDLGAAIPAGSATADAHPHINGSGVAGDIVKVYDNGTLIGSTTVDGTGKWTYTPASNLADGTHSITVVEVNAVGTPSAASNATSVVINTSTPSTPSTPSMTDDSGKAIPAGGTTADPHPHINGNGTAGDTITVYDNGVPIGSTTVGGDGKWSFTPSPDLGPGAHDITVIETNPAGTPSPASNPIHVVIDTSTPATPSAPVMTNDSGVTIPAGGATNDAHPHIAGTGTAGDIIKVYDNGVVIGSTTVGDDGKWSFTPTTDLADGIHSITAVEVNAAGTSSAASAAVNVVINTSKPATPAAPVFTDDNGHTIPAGSVTADAHPHISGTGTVGDTIMVYDGSTLLGSTVVAANGTWTFTPSTDLPAGTHSFNVTETNAAGTASDHSASATVIVMPIPGTPAIPSLTDDMGGAIPAGSSTTDGHPHISGTGTAGDTITVYDGQTAIGSTTVGANGTWTFTPSTDLATGAHSISVVESNLAGSSAHSGNFAYTQTSSILPPANLFGPSSAPAYKSYAVGTSSTGLMLYNSKIAGSYFFPSSVNGKSVLWTCQVYDPNGNYLTTLVRDISLQNGFVDISVDNALFKSGLANVFVFTCRLAGETTTYVVAIETAAQLLAAPQPVTADTNPALLPSGYAANALKAVYDPNASHDVANGTHTGEDALLTPVAEQAATETPLAHVTVNDHDAVTGKSGHDTFDLNVDPTSYFQESTAHIQGSTAHPTEPAGTAPAVNTLHLTGDHQVLDLTSLTGKTAAAKISGIEVIDLGGHENHLKLSLSDVLNLGEQDLFVKDGHQQVMVNGSNGDTVDLSNAHIAGVADGQWQAEGTAVVGGVTYNVYEHSGAHTELLVQQGVQIALHN